MGPLSDIYSLGCTLYYAVTGKVPFPGGNSRSKARRHTEDTPWHPRRFNEEVSDDFVDIIADMMEKDPNQRISSMAMVAERLSAWATDEGPLMTDHLTKRHRWMQASVPGSPDPEDLIDIRETGSASYDVADLGMQEISQASIGTNSGSVHDTRLSQDSSSPPPLPMASEETQVSVSRTGTIIWTLILSAPIFLVIGLVVGFALSMMLNGSLN